MTDCFSRSHGGPSDPAAQSHAGQSRSRLTALDPGSSSFDPFRSTNALPQRPKDMQTRLVDSLGDATQAGDVVRVLEVFQDIRALEMPHLVDYLHSDHNLPALCLAAVNPSNLGCRLVTQLLLLKGANQLNIENLLRDFLHPGELHVTHWASWTARRYQAGDREGSRERAAPHDPARGAQYLDAIEFTADDLDPPAASSSPSLSPVADRGAQSGSPFPASAQEPALLPQALGKRGKRSRGKGGKGDKQKTATEGAKGRARYWGSDGARKGQAGRTAKRARADPPASFAPPAHVPSLSKAPAAKNWPTSADFVPFDTDSTLSLDEIPFRSVSAAVSATAARRPTPLNRRHNTWTAGPSAAAQADQPGDETALAPSGAATYDGVDIFDDDSASSQHSGEEAATARERPLDPPDADSVRVAVAASPAPTSTSDSAGAATLIELRGGAPTMSPSVQSAPVAADAPAAQPERLSPPISRENAPSPASASSAPASLTNSAPDAHDLARMRALSLSEKDVKAVIRVERLKRDVSAADYDAVLRVLRRYIEREEGEET